MAIIFLLPWLEELEKCDSCTEKCCLPIMRGSVPKFRPEFRPPTTHQILVLTGTFFILFIEPSDHLKWAVLQLASQNYLNTSTSNAFNAMLPPALPCGRSRVWPSLQVLHVYPRG